MVYLSAVKRNAVIVTMSSVSVALLDCGSVRSLDTHTRGFAEDAPSCAVASPASRPCGSRPPSLGAAPPPPAPGARPASVGPAIPLAGMPEIPPEPIGPSRMPLPTPGLPETPGADESSPPQAQAKQMEAATRTGKGFRIDPPLSRRARGKAGKNL